MGNAAATALRGCGFLKMSLTEVVCCLILLRGAFPHLGRRTASHEVETCGENISSHVRSNGTIASPNYPEPYPADVNCEYKFTGQEKERVQIIFTDFDLHLPHEPPRDCDSVDAVMVFITINDQKDKVDYFCGNKLPNQLMSNGSTMTVEFRSFHSSPEVKGFRAIYRFVTDFGVIGGRQENDTVCCFTFRSEENRNGTFTSPNYPGYYPRDTECHYIFRGRPRERVHITFAHFDIDGIFPCTNHTRSDYVEFSNVAVSDARSTRHCGKEHPETIESVGENFIVIFKSNEKFDATGFRAFYQFRNPDDPLTVKRISTTTNTNSHACDIQTLRNVLLATIVFCATSSLL